MNKRICRTVCLILLAPVLFLTLTASHAEADTRITITIAGGGVACGVYFFLQFTVRSSLGIEPHGTKSLALFNHTKDGWLISYPSLNLMRDASPGFSRSADSPEGVQIDLLKIAF